MSRLETRTKESNVYASVRVKKNSNIKGHEMKMNKDEKIYYFFNGLASLTCIKREGSKNLKNKNF